MGLEPTRRYRHKILSLACLPIPALPRTKIIISYFDTFVNYFSKFYYIFLPALILCGSPVLFQAAAKALDDKPFKIFWHNLLGQPYTIFRQIKCLSVTVHVTAVNFEYHGFSMALSHIDCGLDIF